MLLFALSLCGSHCRRLGHNLLDIFFFRHNSLSSEESFSSRHIPGWKTLTTHSGLQSDPNNEGTFFPEPHLALSLSSLLPSRDARTYHEMITFTVHTRWVTCTIHFPLTSDSLSYAFCAPRREGRRSETLASQAHPESPRSPH